MLGHTDGLEQTFGTNALGQRREIAHVLAVPRPDLDLARRPLPFLVAAVRVFPPPAFFLPLEVPFFERAFRVATCAPCSATAVAFSFASALVMVVFVILLALASRMTIHHLGSLEMQVKK